MKKQTIVWSHENFRELLTQALSAIGARRALLVCDPSFEKLSIAPAFQELPVELTVFDGFSPNPRYEEAAAGTERFRREGCDSIVAVGGGSALDVAKCVKLFCAMEPGESYLRQEFRETGVPLVAVPTTAGTGSERTRFAVVYDRGEKQSVASDAILPEIVILEPDTLATLPLYQKKAAMMDALCQAIESWWSVNSTGESMGLSRRAVEGILAGYPGYLQNTPKGRKQIMEAASLAGAAINITQTTAAHAMCYKITSLFGTAHGHAAALCLPQVWRFMLAHPHRCCDPRGSEYLSGVFLEIARAMGVETPGQAVERFESLMEELGLTAPALEKEEQLALLAASVNPVRLKNNPVALEETDFLELYRAVFSSGQKVREE